jgi:hypothetical protein
MNIKTMKENNKVIKKKKMKIENTTRQSALKKTYNLIINYLFALATNSRLFSSSNRLTIFLF